MGLITSLIGKGQPSPEAFVINAKSRVQNVERELKGLEWDINREKLKMERVIDRGKASAKTGDAIGKQDALTDLKVHQGVLAQLRNEKTTALKAKTLAKITLARVTSQASGGIMNEVTKLMQLMDDPKIADWLKSQEVTHQHFQEEVMKKFDMSVDEYTEAMAEQEDVSSETDIFDELLAAEESGNDEEASKLRAKLSGEESNPTSMTDFDIS